MWFQFVCNGVTADLSHKKKNHNFNLQEDLAVEKLKRGEDS